MTDLQPAIMLSGWDSRQQRWYTLEDWAQRVRILHQMPKIQDTSDAICRYKYLCHRYGDKMLGLYEGNILDGIQSFCPRFSRDCQKDIEELRAQAQIVAARAANASAVSQWQCICVLIVLMVLLAGVWLIRKINSRLTRWALRR